MTEMDAPTLAEQFAAAGIDWIVPRWPAPANVHAFVTTRNGGVSDGSRASLDAGSHPLRGDPADIAAIVENRRRIGAWLPSAPHWLDQVHGARVVTIEATGASQPGDAVRADAAVTRRLGTVLAIRAADCLPVFLSDREGAVIAAAHAGWRGVAAGVLENTVATMATRPSRSSRGWGPRSAGRRSRSAMRFARPSRPSNRTRRGRSNAARPASGSRIWSPSRAGASRAPASMKFMAAACARCPIRPASSRIGATG